jgi:hypothetical protein
MDAVLATLLNELDAVPGDVVLVLDDHHLIEDRDVNDGVAFLLEHLPSQVHLLIATRADPAMPLARLRGRGELLEVRAADLRFTPEEAAAYLNDVMGLELGTSDVGALEGRTEGWIAALPRSYTACTGSPLLARHRANEARRTLCRIQTRALGVAIKRLPRTPCHIRLRVRPHHRGRTPRQGGRVTSCRARFDAKPPSVQADAGDVDLDGLDDPLHVADLDTVEIGVGAHEVESPAVQSLQEWSEGRGWGCGA